MNVAVVVVVFWWFEACKMCANVDLSISLSLSLSFSGVSG